MEMTTMADLGPDEVLRKQPRGDMSNPAKAVVAGMSPRRNKTHYFHLVKTPGEKKRSSDKFLLKSTRENYTYS